MTKEQNIINKLYEAKKVELGTHKVDLALIDDANKAISEGSKNEANFYSDFKLELNRIIDTARKIEVKYNVLLSNINQPIFLMEKQAKELGLDIKTTPVYKQAQNTIKAIEGRKEVIDSIINNIQKFGF
jgi:hypothetical protein